MLFVYVAEPPYNSVVFKLRVHTYGETYFVVFPFVSFSLPVQRTDGRGNRSHSKASVTSTDVVAELEQKIIAERWICQTTPQLRSIYRGYVTYISPGSISWTSKISTPCSLSLPLCDISWSFRRKLPPTWSVLALIISLQKPDDECVFAHDLRSPWLPIIFLECMTTS